MSADQPRASRPVQILLLLLAIGISLTIVWLTNQYQAELRNLGSAGYVGLFLISLIGNATLIVPAPVFVVACLVLMARVLLSIGLSGR